MSRRGMGDKVRAIIQGYLGASRRIMHALMSMLGTVASPNWRFAPLFILTSATLPSDKLPLFLEQSTRSRHYELPTYGGTVLFGRSTVGKAICAIS